MKVGVQLEAEVDLDLLTSEIPQRPVQEALGLPPSDEEIHAAVHGLRESAP